MAEITEREYVLGTHDDEIERLGMQHRVWRPKVTEAWHRAGFRVGQTLLDVGCGPGYAAIDLAEIVGPSGKVIGFDQSRRFLNALEQRRDALGLRNLEAAEINLDEGNIPNLGADGAWCRWVLSFVSNPEQVVKQVSSVLKRGGAFVCFEYYDYEAYNCEPKIPEFDEFKAAVVKCWRDGGGEPDVGQKLPRWMRDAGLDVRSMTPHHYIFRPNTYRFEWPRVWEQVGMERLVELGYYPKEKADKLSTFLEELIADPDGMVFTPSVLEVIAVKN